MGSLAYWERKLQALDHYVGIKYVLQSLEDKSMQVEITILAAGIGSRMHSNKPKVLQTLAGRTLLDYILAAADSLNPSAIHIVVGQGADMVRAAVSDRSDVNCVDQADRLGTGHAMQQVASHLQDDSRVLMLLGDCPLIHPSTLRELCETPADLAILTVDDTPALNQDILKTSCCAGPLGAHKLALRPSWFTPTPPSTA